MHFKFVGFIINPKHQKEKYNHNGGEEFQLLDKIGRDQRQCIQTQRSQNDEIENDPV
jgi:hypothetical protein